MLCLLQSFLIKDGLPHLASLGMNKCIEIFDAQSQLTNLRDLKISFNTLNKPYHGEWCDQVAHLIVPCLNHVPLGVPGFFPTGLESLCLHTESPEPVTISTGFLKNQPRPYPHQVMQLFHLASASVLSPSLFHFLFPPPSSNPSLRPAVEHPPWPVHCSLKDHMPMLNLLDQVPYTLFTPMVP